MADFNEELYIQAKNKLEDAYEANTGVELDSDEVQVLVADMRETTRFLEDLARERGLDIDGNDYDPDARLS